MKRRLRWGLAATFVGLLSIAAWVSRGVHSPAPFALFDRSKHTVTLRWDASTSKVDGYNVYRSSSKDGPYVKINTEPVKELTFVDRLVENDRRYYYVVRAVVRSAESVDSNRAEAVIPRS
jgi:hypothetical protein